MRLGMTSVPAFGPDLDGPVPLFSRRLDAVCRIEGNIVVSMERITPRVPASSAINLLDLTFIQLWPYLSHISPGNPLKWNGNIIPSLVCYLLRDSTLSHPFRPTRLSTASHVARSFW